MKLMLFCPLLFSHLSFAEVSPSNPKLPTECSEAVPVVVEEALSLPDTKPETASLTPTKRGISKKDNRDASTSTVMVGYQLITSWLPSKKTLSYSHLFSERWTLEGEYSFQRIDTPFIGVDLGEIKERRFTLHARRYVSNSFHFSFGGVLSDFSARLGSDTLDTFGNSLSSSFSARNLGITFGTGNRWQWNNGLTLGVDWIRLNVPLIQTGVEDNVLDDLPGGEDREDIKNVIETFNRIPTFVLLGLHLGYTF
jgi:hypothetical protein